jgi:hypothetical protein
MQVRINRSCVTLDQNLQISSVRGRRRALYSLCHTHRPISRTDIIINYINLLQPFAIPRKSPVIDALIQ